MPLEHLLLPVQRLMIGPLGHDHLRQQTRSRRALLDRLRRLGGRPHRAVAGVLQTDVLDHLHRGRNVFVALAGLFPDQPQILAAAIAVLFRFRQIVHDALALEMPRQRLAARLVSSWRFVRFRPVSRIAIEVIVVLAGSGFAFRSAVPARPPRTAPVDLSRAARSCGCAALPATRAADSDTCSARSERSSCSARSTTILRSVSASCGKMFGSMATCIQLTRKPLRFQVKTRVR